MYMFNAAARVFNQPIGNWNTSSVTRMEHMFSWRLAFNQPIGNWNTAGDNMCDVSRRVQSAIGTGTRPGDGADVSVCGCVQSADRELEHGQGDGYDQMFQSAYAFNQPIGNWNTGKVTKMGDMFLYASAFNQHIGSWNTSQVSHMCTMFASASAFNQHIGNWNTSSVTDMRYVCAAPAFNQPIGNWNTAR